MFIRPPPIQIARLTPHPWSAPPHLYYVLTSLNNDDGHGGYTRLNRFDDDGIPYRPTRAGRRYHPLVVAGYATKMLAIAAATGSAEAAARARRMLPPLIVSSRPTGAWGAGSSPGSMTSQRAHGNVQGMVISAILRLTSGRPGREASDVLQRAVERLLSPVGQGGAMGFLEGGPFLQEAPGTPLQHILNGCVAGLFGLYDMADALGHPEARKAACAIDESLCRNIGRFHALRGWSLYALDVYGSPYLASAYYHWLAIAQLRLLAMRTRSPALLETLDSWERSYRSPRKRCEAAIAKTAQAIWLRDIRRLRLDLCP